MSGFLVLIFSQVAAEVFDVWLHQKAVKYFPIPIKISMHKANNQ